MKRIEYLKTMQHLVGQAKNLARQHGDDQQAVALDEVLAITALDYELEREPDDISLEEMKSHFIFDELPDVDKKQPKIFEEGWLESLNEKEARRLLEDSESDARRCRRCGALLAKYINFCGRCGNTTFDPDGMRW